MEVADIKILLEDEFGVDLMLTVDENSTPTALIVNAVSITEVCLFLRDNSDTFFDCLSCLTAIDNGEEQGTMEVIYNLFSIPLEQSIMLKATISRTEANINTVSTVWQTADWHEREVFDLFGIVFNNHPDLRRILMPADWEGYPMRKDYVEPTTYRGMKTIREEDEPS